jgi:hypothetical protein
VTASTSARWSILGRGDRNQAAEHHGCGRGRAWRVPIIERVDRLDMSIMSIDVAVNNAYSSGNIPLQDPRDRQRQDQLRPTPDPQRDRALPRPVAARDP